MSVPARDGGGTVRAASIQDAGALARLFAVAGVDLMPHGAADLAACLDRGELIVLEIEPEILGAAVHVELDVENDDEVHALLQFFVIHPALAGTGAEEQMAASLLALCEAVGCVDLDVATGR